jgi:dipeptidyl aminopeptidase/acylaminoacyl peptidase
VTDEEKLREITKAISPITFVSASSAPCLIIHGDADNLVPIQQSEAFVAKMKAAGAEAELVVKKGAGHGWVTMVLDVNTLADWFDKHLAKGAAKKADGHSVR